MGKVVGVFRGLDCLINNAAVSDEMESVGECGIGMWERDLRVNLF